MAQQPIVLDSMAPLPVDETGRSIRFLVKGADGREVAVECPHDVIDRVLRFVIELARDAASRRSETSRGSFSRSELVDVEPMPVSGTTFVADPESLEIVQIFRMFGFDLGFSLTPEHLAALKKELDRILPALGGGHDHHHHGHDHDHHH